MQAYVRQITRGLSSTSSTTEGQQLGEEVGRERGGGLLNIQLHILFIQLFVLFLTVSIHYCVVSLIHNLKKGSRTVIESCKQVMLSIFHQRLFEEREETDQLIVLESCHHPVQLQLKRYVPAQTDPAMRPLTEQSTIQPAAWKLCS